jgi:hypothetical protein
MTAVRVGELTLSTHQRHSVARIRRHKAVGQSATGNGCEARLFYVAPSKGIHLHQCADGQVGSTESLAPEPLNLSRGRSPTSNSQMITA